MICLNEQEVDLLRDTLSLIFILLHPDLRSPRLDKQALEVLEKDGADTVEKAQLAILARIRLLQERIAE